jgi:hypothetical protein
MNTGGLGGKEWEELWATAEKYKVPIALRTVFPTRSQVSLAIHVLPTTAVLRDRIPTFCGIRKLGSGSTE